MSARQLNEEWTSYVVGKLHRYRISRVELASKCHYTQTYLSLVLNGTKEFSSDRAKEKTKTHVLRCLDILTSEIDKEIAEDEEKMKGVSWLEYFDKTRDIEEKR